MMLFLLQFSPHVIITILNHPRYTMVTYPTITGHNYNLYTSIYYLTSHQPTTLSHGVSYLLLANPTKTRNSIQNKMKISGLLDPITRHPSVQSYNPYLYSN